MAIGGGAMHFEVRGDLPNRRLRAGVSYWTFLGRVSLAEATACAKCQCKGPEAGTSWIFREQKGGHCGWSGVSRRGRGMMRLQRPQGWDTGQVWVGNGGRGRDAPEGALGASSRVQAGRRQEERRQGSQPKFTSFPPSGLSLSFSPHPSQAEARSLGRTEAPD